MKAIMTEHCKIEKRVYRWESGKLIINLYANKFVEEKTMENWFQHRFPKNKIMRWLKSHLNASHRSEEARRLTGTVVLVRSNTTTQNYYLQYDLRSK